MKRALRLALLAGLAALPAPARAQGALGEGAARLEERADTLRLDADRRLAESAPRLAALARRVRLSASASGVWWDAGDTALVGSEPFQVWDARFFADVLLAEDAGPGEATWLRSAGLSVEWDLVRLGRVYDDLGEAFLELQGLGDSSWWNAQLGRFQIPVGENYLRFSRGYRDNPFITNTVAGAWWWDEGLKLYGSDPSSRFGYVASLTNGETARSFGFEGGDQYTLKLFVNPTSWLHLSVSGLYGGAQGDDEYPAQAALWLGESWGRSFGSGSRVPNRVDGRVVPDAPGRIHSTAYWGADAVFTHPAGARLWLSYGGYHIDSGASALYDRSLHAWIAELVLEGRLATPELRAFYLAFRANGLGTYDRDRGYLLDVRSSGRVGYDARSLEAYSAALGWRVTRWTTLKLEYSRQHFTTVRGASDFPDADIVGVELGLAF
jgi:hypothetical protein